MVRMIGSTKKIAIASATGMTARVATKQTMDMVITPARIA